MPYFITDKSPDCSGWATIKEDGEVIGCHTTKQDAIDQMVAVSIAEEIEPGGERIDSGPQAVIVDIDGTLIDGNQVIQRTYDFLEDMEDTAIFIVTGRKSSQRETTVKQLQELNIKYDRLFMNPNSNDNIAEFKKVTAENLLKEYNVILAIDNDEANRAVFRDLGITALDVSDVPASGDDIRAINQDAPQYMRDAAKRGLELNAQGFGGGGLTDKTIREARLMVNGQVSDDKWIRIAAWIARHLVDLDAPQNSDSDDKGYPGAGLVAHLLWGSGPSKSNAVRTMNYAQGVVERIREDQANRWSSVNILLRKEQETKMKPKVERRIKNDVDFELRIQDGQTDGMRFTGYAAVFNSDSEPLPFTERILPGAFKRSLKSRNEIKLFMNHNMDKVLGSTRAKTLKLTEDSKGLLAEAVLPDTTDGRDLSVLMQRGDVNSMSFGFSVPQGGDRWSNDGQTRELKEVRLHEVSIVTGFPAYEATTASVRSLDTLAQVLGMDADMLEFVISKLEDGEPLSGDQADLLIEVVSKLREQSPVELPMDNEQIVVSVDQIISDEMSSLEIKRKHLDLLFKATQ
jgi:HK97 family phage prohead protease